ncbi:hypothetical protein [Oleiharenicola sp. Vm1]|uniref:hypothetical protein n=1 Tax=Oleiharenicola sp. Vm1 TaxID=3398393 RepID=UPI0039F45625
MTTSRKFLLTLCAVALALPFAGASERAETLRAINWVENPTNHTRPGSRGELGPYQFLPQTWRLHTRTPFSQAIVRAQADAVAVRHYEWIADGLRDAGIDPNPFNIALAWNCGLGAVRAGRVPAVSYAYAQRVQNLVERQRAQRQAALAEAPAVAATPSAPAEAMFAFDTSADATPRFVVATSEPLYNPTVPAALAEKTAPVAVATVEIPVPADMPTVQVEPKAMFTFSSVAAPRFALIH